MEHTIHPEATTQLEEGLREREQNLQHVLNPLTPREQDVLAELTKREK